MVWAVLVGKGRLGVGEEALGPNGSPELGAHRLNGVARNVDAPVGGDQKATYFGEQPYAASFGSDGPS